VTAQLSAIMPSGLTLTAELSPPTGGTSNGPVALDVTARDLVGNITSTTVQSLTLTYTFATTVAAGVVALQSRTVTFTILAWP
jgi:hypothetical protein